MPSDSHTCRSGRHRARGPATVCRSAGPRAQDEHADEGDGADHRDRPEGRTPPSACPRKVPNGTPRTFEAGEAGEHEGHGRGPALRATMFDATTEPMPKNAPWHSAAITGEHHHA